MTAEEFWKKDDKYSPDEESWDYPFESTIDFAERYHKVAREEYAEKKAIEFLKWMERTNTINNSGVPPHILFKMYKNQTKEV